MRELVLNNLLISNAKEIDHEWFITSGRGTASLLHVCKPKLWVDALQGVFMEKDGKLTRAFDNIIDYLYFLAADDTRCKCRKPVPRRVRAMFRLATLDIK